MKQKRKVRNLIQGRESVGREVKVVVLFIASGVLSVMALVFFAMGKVSLALDIQQMQYVGVNDNTESVYEVKFIDPDDLSEDIHSVSQSGTSLYITPNPVVVWGDIAHGTRINEVSDGIYGHILGGQENKISSNNVTIIAGKRNKVNQGNDGSTIVGGKNNEMGTNGNNKAVMVGGEGNAIGSQGKGEEIIGGEGNKIVGGNNVAVLGMGRTQVRRNNGVQNEIKGENVIVGGIDVDLRNNSNTKNIFAYSNQTIELFTPVDGEEGSNAFYLNMTKGVGINTQSSGIGLDVGGAVGFGEIDIENNSCTESNNGVQGMWNGCLVGCTKESAKNSKWEMMDQGEVCMGKCKGNGKCIAYEEIVENVEGVCEGNANTRQSEQCCGTGNEKTFYNTIFEKTLIDSEMKCPNKGGDQGLINNRCVFRCETGTHLTGDTTGRGLGVGCYKDCTLDGQTIKHNETITGYNVREVSCSNDDYIFPFISKTNNLFKTIPLPEGISSETCGNYKHRELLICIDGTLYLEKDRETLANADKGDSEDAYNKASCELKEYRCDTSDGNYNLSMKWLRVGAVRVTPKTTKSEYSAYVTPYEDSTVIYSSRDAMLDANDRSSRIGAITKGKYELCIDFDAEGNDVCNRVGQAAKDETKYHYKLVGCEAGYATGATHPYECRQEYEIEYDYGTNAQYPTNNKHSVSGVKRTIYTRGEKVDLTPEATKLDLRDNKDYDFLGWHYNKDAKEGLKTYNFNPDNFDDNGGKKSEYKVKLYAIYKRTYTANFDKNGATNIGTTKLTCEVWNNTPTCTVKAPSITRTSKDAKNPFTIVGWSTDKNAKTGTQVGQNLTIPADSTKTSTTWYAITKKGLTITFYKNENISQTDAAGKLQTTDTVTRTCEIWNSATTCSVTSPAINASETVDVLNSANKVKKTPIGYSTAANRHVSDYPVNTARAFEDNTSFYAQSKKDITVTFKLNGNISQTNSGGTSILGDVTRTGTYYNGETYYTIKSPRLDPNKTPVEKAVIGYSTAANRHVSDWNIETNKNISDNVEYYAQSKKDVTVTLNANGNLGTYAALKCTYYNNQEKCGSAKCDVNECKSVTCPSIKVNENPVAKTVMGWSTMSNEYHTACNVNTAITPTDNVEYYAWSKKDVTVTFNINGNGGSNSTAECTYYNDMTGCGDTKCYSAAAGCKAPVSPKITANANPNQKDVIGWSTASDRHVNDWTPSTAQNQSDSKTYYAQSKKDVTIIFNKNGATSQTIKGGSANTATTVSQKCTYYNNETSCSDKRSENTNTIRSPTISRSNFTIVGYNTNKDATTSTWNHNTKKTDLVNNDTYYAITNRKLVLTVKKDDTSVSSIGGNQSCEIWNTATSCDVTFPTITCGAGWSNGLWNTSSAYPNPKSNGKTQGSKLTLTANVTYYGVCEDETAPACTITTQPTKSPISLINGYTQGTFTVTCTDLGSKVKTTSLAASAIEYNSNYVTLSAATIGNVTNGRSYTFTYTSKAQGTTTFKLKAGQVSDNWNNSNAATSATSIVTIDTTKPTLSADNSGAWKTANTTITLSVGDAGGAGLNYAKYSWTSATDCTSNGTSFSNGTKITNSTEGVRTLYLCAGDKAGNTNTWDAKYYLDKTAPTCTNRGDSTTWTNSNRTIYRGCSDGNSGCETAEASTTYSTTTQTATIAAYTIKDKAGNSTNCAARTANVYVDKTAPSCTNGGDSTTCTKDNRTISYGCSDGNSGCNSSYAGGSKAFTTTTKTSSIAAYTIKDNAGNSTDCAVRTANVYVDKTAPTGSITINSDAAYVTSASVTLNLSASDTGCAGSVSKMRFSCNNSTWSSWENYATSKSWTFGTSYGCTASDGTKTVYVQYQDAVGNVSTSYSDSIIKDTVAPVCGTATNASTTWTNVNRTIKQACSDATSGCKKTSYDTTYSTTTKTSSVTIYDNAGNSRTCTYNVYVDKTAPVCGTATNVSTTWTKDNRTIKQACSDSDSGCAKTSYDTTYSTTTKTSSVTIYDNAGNSETCTYNVYVDKTPPVCGTATNASTTWTDANRTIKQACSDSDSGCAKTSYDTTYSTTTKTSNVTIYDNAGNSKTCTYNVYVDKTAPVCGSWSYSQSACNTSWTATLASSTDADSGIQTAGGTCTISTNNTTCSVTIKDNVGNTKSCTSASKAIQCKTPWGTCVAAGESATAYSVSAPTCPTTCSSQQRTCGTNGSWDSAFTYTNSSCTTKSTSCNTSYPLTSQNVANAESYYTCTYYTSNGQGCSEGYRYALKTCKSGYTKDGNTCKKNCTICGATVAHGKSRTCYYDDDPAGACGSEVRTCNDGTVSGSYEYASCNAGCKYPWNNNYMKHGASITAWSTSSATSPTMCASQKRTCSNGSLGGSYTNSSCTQYYRSCTICGTTVAHGDGKTCYKSSSPTCPSTCSSAWISCNDGTISEYGYGASSCSPQSVSVNTSGYPLTSCPSYGYCSSSDGYTVSGNSCSKYTRYSLDGCSPKTYSTYTLDSCPTGGNCSSDWGYYQSGNSCVKYYRYKLNSCQSGYTKVGNTCKKDCTICGSTVAHGSGKTCYKSSSPTCPTTCSSAYVTCNNGTASSTSYPYGSCSPKAVSTSYSLTSCPSYGYCDSDYGYTVSGNSCTQYTRYALDGCEPKASSSYPLDSCPANGNCSSDYGYYNKSGNSCVKYYKYKLDSCQSGYTKNGNTCVQNAQCYTQQTCWLGSVPSSNNKLCSVGIASTLTVNNGLFTWTCTNGNSTVNCSTCGACRSSGACSQTYVGGTCTSYSRCSSSKITSTCQSTLTWSNTPGNYSSAGQGCYSCTYNGSTYSDGDRIYTYSTNSSTSCSSYRRASKCVDGSWSVKPYSYSSCSAPSASCETPRGTTVSHGNGAYSYTEDGGSFYVDITRHYSKCNNGSWDYEPEYQTEKLACEDSGMHWFGYGYGGLDPFCFNPYGVCGNRDGSHAGYAKCQVGQPKNISSVCNTSTCQWDCYDLKGNLIWDCMWKNGAWY